MGSPCDSDLTGVCSVSHVYGMTRREIAARQLEDIERALSATASELGAPDHHVVLGLVLTVAAVVDMLRRLDADPNR